MESQHKKIVKESKPLSLRVNEYRKQLCDITVQSEPSPLIAELVLKEFISNINNLSVGQIEKDRNDWTKKTTRERK